MTGVPLTCIALLTKCGMIGWLLLRENNEQNERFVYRDLPITP